jgi:hypothetical protein
MGTGPSSAQTSRIERGRGIDQTVGLKISEGRIRESRISPGPGVRTEFSAREKSSSAIRDRVQRALENNRPFSLRFERELQRPDVPAPDQAPLPAHRRIPGADPRRDDRVEPERPRLRPHPQSLPPSPTSPPPTPSPPSTSAKPSNIARLIGRFGYSDVIT